MKGVVVQVGEPKSIVLLNNGKIVAVPTPAEAHVGMEITVRISRKIKILTVVFAVFLVVCAAVASGIIINSASGSRDNGNVRTEENEEDYSYKKGLEKNIELQKVFENPASSDPDSVPQE